MSRGRIKSNVSEKDRATTTGRPGQHREAHPGLHPQEHFRGLVPDLGVFLKSQGGEFGFVLHSGHSLSKACLMDSSCQVGVNSKKSLFPFQVMSW